MTKMLHFEHGLIQVHDFERSFYINIPLSCIWWYDSSMIFMAGAAHLNCEIAPDIFEILCRNRRSSKQTAIRTAVKYKLRLRCRIIRNIQLLYISTIFQIKISYLNFYSMDKYISAISIINLEFRKRSIHIAQFHLPPISMDTDI